MRVSQRIQLMVTFLSLLIHDDLLVKDMVGSVEIHNHTLIWRRKENTGNDAENDKIPLEKSPFVSPLFESVPSVEPPWFQRRWRRWFRTCDGLQGIAPYLQNRMCFFDCLDALTCVPCDIIRMAPFVSFDSVYIGWIVPIPTNRYERYHLSDISFTQMAKSKHPIY